MNDKLEARYFYYPHGALARMELGKKQVQGIDYAYTLQGWLKDMNGYRTDCTLDIGKDGNAASTDYIFARDANSLMLQYYQTDYRPVNQNNLQNKTATSAVDLYNGNISGISAGYYGETSPLLKAYRYDKLNRIRSMQTATVTGTQWGTLTNNYFCEYHYDFNGNIVYLKRYRENLTFMHNITYQYTSLTNRLSAITTTGDLNSSTYKYDAIGNLTKDLNENVQVFWNASGKVKQVVTPECTINYTYNPLGQRQSKEIIGDSTVKEWYLHDATGNIMCIYRKTQSMHHLIYAAEQPIYGSKRLGVYERNEIIYERNMKSSYQDTVSIRGRIGDNRYELTDHLGNILSIVSDRKLGVGSNGVISYYSPEIRSYTDYYPFGFPIPDRSADLTDYRFGFNGKENDNEIYGNGAMQNYGFRMYDIRLARFWGVDPIAKDYPWYSPYQFAGNKPIWAVDLDGLEEYFTASGEVIGKYGASTEIRIVHKDYIEAAKNIIANQNQTSSDILNNKLYNFGSHGVFQSNDEAAKDWSKNVNPVSIQDNLEYGSSLYELDIKGSTYITYTEAKKGTPAGVAIPPAPVGKKRTGTIHAHGAYDPNYDNDQFSPQDKTNAYIRRVDTYVSTPSGELWKYEINNGNESQIEKNIPSDPKDPDRINNVPPEKIPTIIK